MIILEYHLLLVAPFIHTVQHQGDNGNAVCPWDISFIRVVESEGARTSWRKHVTRFVDVLRGTRSELVCQYVWHVYARPAYVLTQHCHSNGYYYSCICPCSVLGLRALPVLVSWTIQRAFGRNVGIIILSAMQSAIGEVSSDRCVVVSCLSFRITR